MDFIPNQPGIYDIQEVPSIFSYIFNLIVSVKYSDPPIIFLLIFLFLWNYFLIKFRNNVIISSIMFLFVTAFTGFTPKINAFLSNHYQSFGFSSQYFDPSCLFIFVYWSVPLLVGACVFLIFLACDVFKLLCNESLFSMIKRYRNKKKNSSSDAEGK